MAMRRRHWVFEIENIKNMLDAGYTQQKIADSYGVSRQLMHKVLKEYGQISDKKTMVAELNSNVKPINGLSDIDTKMLLRAFFYRTKENSARQKHKFTLELADIYFVDVCPITERDICYVNEEHLINSPTIHKFNYDLGYVPGNCMLMSRLGSLLLRSSATGKELVRAGIFKQQLEQGLVGINSEE